MKYFAYGSNMSHQRLLKRCPSAVSEGVACISRYSLRFHKPGIDGTSKADCFWTGDTTDVVYGVIYHINKCDVQNLDAAEGEGAHYERVVCKVVDTFNRRRTVQVYKALLFVDGVQHPSPEYLQYIVQGAVEHCLPVMYTTALQNVQTQQIQQETCLDTYITALIDYDALDDYDELDAEELDYLYNVLL